MRPSPFARAIVAAAALAALVPQCADCAELGRLFFTPQERSAMDHRRYAPGPEAKVEAAPALAPGPVKPSAPNVVTLEGYVSRSDGHSTTWVNGVPRNDHLQLNPNGVRVNTNQRAVDLNVGESYDAESGERRGVMPGNGTVSVKP